MRTDRGTITIPQAGLAKATRFPRTDPEFGFRIHAAVGFEVEPLVALAYGFLVHRVHAHVTPSPSLQVHVSSMLPSELPGAAM